MVNLTVGIQAPPSYNNDLGDQRIPREHGLAKLPSWTTPEHLATLDHTKRFEATMMDGKIVLIGNGQKTAEVKENASAIKEAFSQAGHVMASVARGVLKAGAAVVGVVLFPVTLSLASLASKYHSTVSAPRADAEFRVANERMVQNLEQVEPGSLAANDAIMGKLAKHAESMGNTITHEELKQYVAAGEKIANALGEPGDRPPGSEGKTSIRGPVGHIEVKSSLYTTRALSWTMMAKAAEMDMKQQAAGSSAPGNMVTSGSFVMKDPGNHLFNFLSAAPTAGDRISTHFNERADHNRVHGFMGTKPIQRGIEDFSNKLPGQKGTMLFDKLRDNNNGSKELFVKFESVGCPPVFQSASDIEGKSGVGVVAAFSAIHRNLGHAVSFMSGQKANTEDTVLRQEHAYKGMLKADVMQPFEALVKLAKGVVTDDVTGGSISPSVMRAGAKSYGLPFVLQVLNELAEVDSDSDDPHNIGGQARDLLSSIKEKTAPLDSLSGQYGIERRGAEVHISMAPPEPDRMVR